MSGQRRVGSSSGRASKRNPLFDSVTSSTATLNATVNPNGYATTYYFEYGTTTSYGTTTTSTSAGSGTSAVSATANLTGLSPGTTYDFKIVATNANGTTYGPNGTFATLTGTKSRIVKD